MEIKINKEIRNYTENIYFGLSLRQFIFSVCALVIAVILYFILKPYFGIETLSWVCILGASPFALLGFVTYNGMTAEEFIKAYIRTEFLMPRVLCFKTDNYYYKLLEPVFENIKKKGLKNDEVSTKKDKKRKRQSKCTE